MVEPHSEVSIPVEEVQAGFSLAIVTPEGRRLFQVENVKWLYKPASGGPVYTLTSEPLPDGKPWEIDFPAGSIVTRVGAAMTTTERQPIPAIVCESWCEDGDGHPDNFLRENQTCWGTGTYVDLTLEPAHDEDGPYLPRIGAQAYRQWPGVLSVSEDAEYRVGSRHASTSISTASKCPPIGAVTTLSMTPCI